MNKLLIKTLLGVSAIALLTADIFPQGPLVTGVVKDARAIVGRPLTPVSYAGVARRTTRRAVAYSAPVATTVVVATPPPTSYTYVAPPPASSSVPAGTVVTSLPDGCAESTSNGTTYYNCGGTRYRAAFQGNNLVYVSQ